MRSKEEVRSRLIRRGRERYLMIKNYRKYLPAIKRACEKVFGECELYVFGSVLTGKFTAGSDVDLLIKVREAPQSLRERVKLEVRIEELAGLPEYHPFEFHIVDEKGFRRYVNVLKVKPVKVEQLL
ncbi:nucleotidyltransferase domain-containing protein [Thermococcus gammatolerans]|uniref:Nucleotidyltransferase of the DNA polymerase beta family n=1 Tax=Thermococcus gammatolerans (strain DSM 15229 / JCM 11827 / EJ3) TaxID=593117 RepID=C5A5Z4_THEGJ|nr:nucleotidyltransferase domain-containing protein [Thermococcus gammatolerans]ACS33656.1 Nucleotidyltransferase of the DNA polymerase beta family [Thermococcus gammatolerans EJ3]